MSIVPVAFIHTKGGPSKEDILRRGRTLLTQAQAITQKLYQPDTHCLFGFGFYGGFYQALHFRISRNQEAKVFFLRRSFSITFHDTSETVDELPNLAAVHDTFVLTLRVETGELV